MTEQQHLATLHPDARAAVLRLLDWAESTLGTRPKITSSRRSCAEQNALYAQGRTEPGGVVTNARGCRSWHVLGRSVDLYLNDWDCSSYEPLATQWQAWGGVWGGNFPGLRDCVHFEWHPGMTITQACPDPDACSDTTGPVTMSSVAKNAVGFALLGLGVYVAWRTLK